MYFATDDINRGSGLVRRFGSVNALSVIGIDRLPAARDGVCLAVVDVDLSDKTRAGLVQSRLASYLALGIPLIFLTDIGSHHQTTQAWACGASVVVARQHASAELPAHIARLAAESVTRAVDSAMRTLDAAFLAVSMGHAVARSHIEARSDALLATIESAGLTEWLNRTWSVDEQTSQHCLLVAGFSAAFAVHLGFAASDRLDLTHAAMLHDVGKARIPADILNKPSRLSPEETAIVRQHPFLGWQVLAGQSYEDSRLLDAVLHHHEFLDGTGYPDGLSGAQISDFVRIITLCDIFGALLERRPYKPALEPSQALAIMTAMGGRLDPDLLRAFGRFVHANALPVFDDPLSSATAS